MKTQSFIAVILICFLWRFNILKSQNVGIGNTFFTPDNSSLLEIRGNKGVLFPRITTAERDAINNPAQSLVIFNSTTQCFETYINSSWQVIKCFSCQGTVNYFGISYTMVPVGSQCWLKENLRTTKFNDGTNIPKVIDPYIWPTLTTPGYCWFNNDSLTYSATYGALYNWYAVNTGKLCPIGWHVPSDAEWKTMEIYLGMTQIDADNTGWSRGTNEGSKLAGNSSLWVNGALELNSAFGTSGFTALPGGYRDYGNGQYDSTNYLGRWWNTGYDADHAYARGIDYNKTTINRTPINKHYGLSVRCLRDN